MHLRCFITLVFSSLVVMAMVLMVPSVVLGQDGPVPPPTPPGVTLGDVGRELPTSSYQVLWTRLGDAEGRTVFRSSADSPGVSRCDATWAVEFPPLLADASATPWWRSPRWPVTRWGRSLFTMPWSITTPQPC